MPTFTTIDNDLLLDSFRGKTVLITGGAGYLAAALVALLRRIPCRILRLDRRGSEGEPLTGPAEIVNIVSAMNDQAAWDTCLDEHLEGVDVIFHFAAQTSATVADADPEADLTANLLPMLALLEGCRRKKSQPTVCFASTVTIAGIPERLPVDETHPDRPLTMYDLHKQMAEQYLSWYSGRGIVKGVALRLANLYGPGPRSSRSDRGILNQMIRRARNGETLTVYGSGDYLRDYLYVEDAAWAFLAAARSSEALSGRRFVIGTGQGQSIAEAMALVAAQVAIRTGIRVAVCHIDPPEPLSPIELRHFVADPRAFTAATGWRPRHTLAEGIDRTLDTALLQVRTLLEQKERCSLKDGL